MNANELADKLQMDKARALLYVDIVVEAAAMLRHQENQIQVLKMQLAYLETKVYGGSTK
jgi:hypothetical protein